MSTQVYIGVGSNLDVPVRQVTEAVQLLNDIEQSHVLAVSRLYRSVPMAAMDQPDYINAVVRLETDLSAIDLLDRLQMIERNQGRDHNAERWSARVLDLDILLFGTDEISTTRLTVPHYGLHQRSFVLLPLSDLDVTLSIPGKGLLEELLAHCDISDIELVNE